MSAPRMGVVFGAGGALGWAYHLGVAEGLRQALRFEIAHASRIVGTSAGATIAASVLAGASSSDVLAAIDQPLSSAEEEELREARDQLRKHPLRTLRPQAPTMVRKGGLTGLVGLAPAGVFPMITLRRFPIDRLDGWPSGLWVPAVRVGDGEVVVFGRDRTGVEVIDALEATASVPGRFRPKSIDGERFMDGAVASSTHADLLVDERCDTVIVSSPMTRPAAPGKRIGPVRKRAQRQLEREVRALRDAGKKVVVLEPDQAVMTAAAGYPRTTPGAGADVVATARRQTARIVQQELSIRGR